MQVESLKTVWKSVCCWGCWLVEGGSEVGLSWVVELGS